jgi:hypothetical protein
MTLHTNQSNTFFAPGSRRVLSGWIARSGQPGKGIVFSGSQRAVARDIPEAYKTDGDMVCGTHMVYMSSPEREEATFLLLPRATSCI